MKARIRAVLFDYGGTLVRFDFPRDCLLATLATFQGRLGPQAPPPEALLTSVLEPLEADLSALQGDAEVRDYLAFYARAWSRAGLHLDAGLLEEILDAEQRCWDEAVRLEAGAAGTLARLRELGLALGVVSNAPFPPRLMHRQLRGNGLAGQVDTVIFSSEVGQRKPGPAIYREALSRLGARPEEALFVGDSVVEDYEGPRRVGMAAALYAPPPRVPPAGVRAITGLELVEGLL